MVVADIVNPKDASVIIRCACAGFNDMGGSVGICYSDDVLFFDAASSTKL